MGSCWGFVRGRGTGPAQWSQATGSLLPRAGAQDLDRSLAHTRAELRAPRPVAAKGKGRWPAAFPEDPFLLLTNKQASLGTSTGVERRGFRSAKNRRLRKNPFAGSNRRPKSPGCTSEPSCPKGSLSWFLDRRLRPHPIRTRPGPSVVPTLGLVPPQVSALADLSICTSPDYPHPRPEPPSCHTGCRSLPSSTSLRRGRGTSPPGMVSVPLPPLLGKFLREERINRGCRTRGKKVQAKTLDVLQRKFPRGSWGGPPCPRTFEAE